MTLTKVWSFDEICFNVLFKSGKERSYRLTGNKIKSHSGNEVPESLGEKLLNLILTEGPKWLYEKAERLVEEIKKAKIFRQKLYEHPESGFKYREIDSLIEKNKAHGMRLKQDFKYLKKLAKGMM